jgi:hypothetical protein
MRSLLLRAGAATLLALAMFSSPSVAQTTTLQSGDACSNAQALQCAEGLRCYDNKCATSVDAAPSGFGNKCSAEDCCPTTREDGSESKLVCNKLTNRCGPSVARFTELVCGGGENTPEGSDLPTIDVPGVGVVDPNDALDNLNNGTLGEDDVGGAAGQVIDGIDGGGSSDSNSTDSGTGGDVVINNPPPGEPDTVTTSSGTVVVNPDGSVEQQGAAARSTAASAVTALTVAAGVAVAAILL